MVSLQLVDDGFQVYYYIMGRMRWSKWSMYGIWISSLLIEWDRVNGEGSNEWNGWFSNDALPVGAVPQ